ncbi:MAG: hypothetical protein IH609_00400 [Dehalococcoidia bacterium]|nr:hypothetical protein [Dehalococcoidia bacterium]
MVTIPIADAPDPLTAEIWLAELRAAGIRAGTFERGVGGALGGAATPGLASYPVLVSEDDAVRARDIVAGLGGGEYLRAAAHPGGEQGARQLVVLGIGAAIAAALLVVAAVLLNT